MNDIDKIDELLLSALQNDSKTSLDKLATLTDTSTATVQRRINRLRESGAIMSDTVLVDPLAFGFAMTFVLLIELDYERAHDLTVFRRLIQAESQVQQAYYVTGESDFVVICLAKDMADFETLTQRLFFNQPNVRKFRTYVVMDRTKVGLKVEPHQESK